MRLTRVFVDAALGTDVLLALPAGPAQHLARVLRLAAGDAVTVFNGQGGEYGATIEAVKRDAVTVRIGAHQAIERESPLATTLLQGIARGEKMDQILQKATELGVTRVVPVMTTRSTVRLNAETGPRKREHWQGVVIGACEQSGRNRVPVLDEPVVLATAVGAVQAQLKLVLAPDENAESLQSLLAAGGSTPPASLCMLVGPEGGLDPEEIRIAGLAGFRACRVGPRVLRTETAALAVLAALQFSIGDFASP
jgi:16S rRNA (uracil1498-N3)-methyltransferase